MFVQFDKKFFVEFERARKLLAYLPHALEELRKNGRRFLLAVIRMAQSMAEFVAKGEQFFLDMYLKAVYGAIITI